MIRIIGGSAKRHAIHSTNFSAGVRPILARIRKSLFDILKPRLEGAVFLDMYAGTGVVGLEALSRGASRVYFIEKNPQCIKVIQRNMRELGFYDRGAAHRADATKPFTYFAPQSFDLIFMGPPYHDEKRNRFHLTQPTLQNIEYCQVLKPEGWVIGQHHVKENPVSLPHWEMFRQEKYGDTLLSFFQQKKKA